MVTATRLGASGQVTVPSSYWQVLGIREGDEVVIRLENGELKLTSRVNELRRAQALIFNQLSFNETPALANAPTQRPSAPPPIGGTGSEMRPRQPSSTSTPAP